MKHMKNVYSYDLAETESAVKLAKTEDLETSCGVIFITGEDDRETQLEVQLLHQLEDRYFRTLYHGVGEKETPLLQDTASCAEILNMTHARGNILVVSDRDNTDCHAVCVRPQDLGSAMDSYDNVLFDGSFYGEGHEVEETVERIFDAMKKVRVGGRFIVSENFYQRIPYGRTFIDALMMIGGFRILAPDSTQKQVVMGFRKPEGEPDGKQSA